MYKKIIFFIILILPFALKVDFCAQLDEIYTWNDLYVYAQQLYDYPDTYRNAYDDNLKYEYSSFINHYDFVVNKCNEFGWSPSLSYGTAIKFNRSGNTVEFTVYFFTSNSVYNTSGFFNTISNSHAVIFSVNKNNDVISYKNYYNNTTCSLGYAPNDAYSNFGLTSGRLKAYSAYNNYENRFIIFTPTTQVINEQNNVIGSLRIGTKYYNQNNIYELNNIDLELSEILTYDNNDTFLNSSYIFDLKLDDIKNIKDNQNYRVYVISPEQKTLYKSNFFELTKSSLYESTITNASGEVVGSINNDKIINSINNLNQNQQNFNNQFFNSGFSGDFDTPTPDLESPAEPFYQNLVNHLVDALKNTEVQSISVQMPAGETITIRSDCLTWNNEPVHNFMQIVWWLAFGYAFFKVVYFIYEKLSTADFMGVINELELDKDIF